MVGMKLSDLDQEERLALVGLVKGLLLADLNVTDDEAKVLPVLVEEVGRAAFDEAFVQLPQRFADEDAFKTFVQATGRPEARALIFETLSRLASVDGVAASERSQLAWLEGAWSLKPPAP
jgi:hypothetical protein